MYSIFALYIVYNQLVLYLHGVYICMMNVVFVWQCIWIQVRMTDCLRMLSCCSEEIVSHRIGGLPSNSTVSGVTHCHKKWRQWVCYTVVLLVMSPNFSLTCWFCYCVCPNIPWRPPKPSNKPFFCHDCFSPNVPLLSSLVNQFSSCSKEHLL